MLLLLAFCCGFLAVACIHDVIGIPDIPLLLFWCSAVAGIHALVAYPVVAGVHSLMLLALWLFLLLLASL